MWKHKGFTITVSKYSGFFESKIGDVEISESTLREAYEAIDKEISGSKAKKTVALKVIGILDPQGVGRYHEKKFREYKIHRGTLTGVNRTTRDLQIEGIPDGYNLGHVIADTPQNEAHLKRYAELHAACDKIDSAHEKLVLSGSYPGYGRLDLPNYDKVIAAIQKSYDAQVGKGKESKP